MTTGGDRDPRIVCVVWLVLSSACASAGRLGTEADDVAIPQAYKHGALLQISSESTRSLPSNALLANHSNAATGRAPWQRREFHLVPHHKTGTVMTHEAVESMIRAALNGSSNPLPSGLTGDDVVDAAYSDNLEALVNAEDLPIPWIEASMHGMGLATDVSMMQTSESPKCIAHIMRNPFEVVVSGYIYHKAGLEAWLGVPFSDADTTCHWKYFAPIVEEVSAQEENCYRTYCKGVAEVMHRSISGSASPHLPDAEPSESYSEYLNRVNVTVGLIAESIWVVNSSLAPMRFLRDFTDTNPCSANMCLSEFYDDCKSAWARVLQAWEVEEPQRTVLLDGAMRSCPGASAWAREHSSQHAASSSHIALPPEREMIALAREIDHTLFNGSMAALEDHLGCPTRGKYKQS